jgi:hypothetical protein
MTEVQAVFSLRRLYWLTITYAVLGFVLYLSLDGPKTAFACLAGSAGSFANLWLFDWLSLRLAPGEKPRRPWQTGTYVTRFLVFVGLGYVIVKGLGVDPLPVILGFLASTAAAITSILIELIESLFGTGSTPK